MSKQTLLFGALALLCLVNIFVMRRLFRGIERPRNKVLFLVAIWILPFLGAMFVYMTTRSTTLSPYPIGGPENPPVAGSL